MNRRMTILAALIAATMAIGVIPALAVGNDTAGVDRAPRTLRAERPRPERTFPPEWIGQTADEVRDRAIERAAEIEERIADNDRLTEAEKVEILANLDATLDAIADLDEPAEIVGTIVSRRQLERLSLRAERRGDSVDYDGHIARDVERFSLRLDHLTKIAGWAAAAGEDVSAVTGYLDNASALLEVADGTGTVEERHDAAHIARAWMTQASVALMAL